jgi:hypothetical protein
MEYMYRYRTTYNNIILFVVRADLDEPDHMPPKLPLDIYRLK